MTGFDQVFDQMTVAAILNDGAIFPNDPSHDFTGIDGRCGWCDCRPYGRWAPLPCKYSPWTEEVAA